jgi:AcrR family transcriptional regulator
MARPKQPLISQGTAVQAALEIIDSHGLDAFSLPRLARHMGVRAPSLYHHFEDKSAILAAVARAVVAETRMPRKPPPDQWQEWFVKLSLNFRAAVLRHRNAAPLLLQYPPREAMTRLYDDAADYLQRSGVPPRVHLQILDGLEPLTFGATLIDATRPTAPNRPTFADVDPDAMPQLAAAVEANPFTPLQIFEQTIRGFLVGTVELDRAREPSTS